jgi:hypothetical protein
MEGSSYVALMGATTSSRTTEIDIEQLAWDVAADGPVAHHDQLTAVARTARMAGIAFIAAGVLADPSAPAVARQRALGIIATELAVTATTPAAHAVA